MQDIVFVPSPESCQGLPAKKRALKPAKKSAKKPAKGSAKKK
eukprot:gene445-4975_t